MQFSASAVDEIFAEFNRSSEPGVAVGVAVDGTPVYRKGFGVASLDLPVLLTPNTRMRIGSVSKQFTAFAYLLLCEEGKASIDDPVGLHFPEFHPLAKRVTMRQLLGHVSGLRDATNIRFRLGGYEGRFVQSAEILALYQELDDCDAAAGTTWLYNNGTYLILSAAVERIADCSFGDFLWRRIFAPIGMYDTMVRRSDTNFVGNSAVSHTLVPEGWFEKKYWGIEFGGAGDIVSTADDLLRWLIHMGSPWVGSEDTWSLMKTPQVLSNGTSTGYGCGLMRRCYRGIEVLCHGGGWIGGNAQAMKVPSIGLDIAVIANRSDAFSPVLVNRILDGCVPNLAPLPASSRGPPKSEGFSLFRVGEGLGRLGSTVGSPAAEPGNAAFVTGTFRSSSGERIVELFPGDGRQIVSIDAHDLPYDRLGDRTLAPIPIWSHVRRFIDLLGDPSDPSGIRLDDFGDVEELSAVRMPAPPEGPRMVGEYRAKVAEGLAKIALIDDRLLLVTECKFGRAEYDMTVLCERTCRLRCASSGFLDAIAAFNGDYSAFYLSSYNVRRFPFVRIR